MAVTPDITYAAIDAARHAIVVSGYVPGVVERGGTCTAVATSGSTTKSQRQSATVDATSSSCGDVVIVVDTALWPWTVRLEYDSSTSHGVSEQVEVSR